ncbi:hypothetical protein [Candidatus Odyssella acanthamoebae]|uniref:Uncharacterized protein n=1 Tax=Candidatus Odyssella acanthamoebae TaxID=91604 RepID=A0A077AXT8_9PROT|nr:hypothetical protein [Candidatus Paracaedibacter acanthamoebae]AIK96428.1 hypothetical protein ID47_06265 [Candidatus Paracaedibacter acanthamoebae]
MVKFKRLSVSLGIIIGIAHSNNALENSYKRRIVTADAEDLGVCFQVQEQEIKVVNPIDLSDIQSSKVMVKHLKATKQFMPPQSYTNIQPTQSVLTGRYMDAHFNSDFYIKVRDVVNVSLSLWDVKGEATFVTPKFKAKDFSLTLTGAIKILAPQDSDSWLKGVVINPSRLSDQPVHCILSGDINFGSQSTIDNFLVIGSPEIEFLL